MKFRLSYEGEVPSAQSKPGPAKVAMRESFRGQLERLWAKTPFLNNAQTQSLDEPYARLQVPGHPFSPFHTGLGRFEDDRLSLAEAIGRQNIESGIRFVPLVSSDAGIRCSLDILLLRADGARSPVSSGDLDNRVKTIIDALKKPKNSNELTAYRDPATSLFHVLLMDDDLLDGLKVETDDLLDIPHDQKKNAKWSKLIVNVQVSVSTPTGFNLQMLA